MLPRYSRPQMVSIWDQENQFRIWLQIEILASEAQGHTETALALQRIKSLDPKRIAEIELDTQHEMLAFLTHVSERTGIEARFLHHGMTSSDVLDTAMSVQLTQATDILLADLDLLLAALERLAIEHKQTLCIARTHGIHAEPTTFGLKLLGHYAAFKRNKQRLVAAREEIAVCQLSGAVGTYAMIDPKVESYVAAQLNLKPETVSTQIIPRDRHAAFFATLGLIASSIENLALEIRHLQRTDVSEAQESFGQKQKGSSAMPHKRNPILCENLTGLARLIRAAVTPALENVALWHERDMSHSSVERVLAPDVTCTLDFALTRLTHVIKHLVVYPERMKANLDRHGGLYASQSVLLALTETGLSREEAYSIVQKIAMQVWDKGGSFQEQLGAHEIIGQILSKKQLACLFDTTQYLKQIDAIFQKVLTP